MVRHLGVFEFKKDVTNDDIEHCFSELMKMVGVVPGLVSMEHGPYKSAEGLNDGFTHGFIMTFDTEESRDNYLPHPFHLERVELIQPKLERLVVFDFNLVDSQSTTI